MKNITFTPQAYKDYLGWLREDKKILQKSQSLFRQQPGTRYQELVTPKS